MKAKLHIKIGEFEFLELDEERGEGFNSKELKRIYDEVVREFEPKEGLEPKEWNSVLDKYLTENTMESNQHERMSPRQQRMIQEIKKSFARLKVNK